MDDGCAVYAHVRLMSESELDLVSVQSDSGGGAPARVNLAAQLGQRSRTRARCHHAYSYLSNS